MRIALILTGVVIGAGCVGVGLWAIAGAADPWQAATVRLAVATIGAVWVWMGVDTLGKTARLIFRGQT